MFKRIVLLTATCVLIGATAWAQTQITTGVIQGQVFDQTEAVLPGVTVDVRHVETNLTRMLVTNEEGRFAALALQPGNYVVTFTLSGFATLIQDGIVLTVGQAIDLRPVMQIAGAQETITVTGTPLIEIASTEVSNTLNQTTVETTPVLGRKFEDLLTLTPGVSIVQGPDGDSINFFGQRGIFNNISLDGGDYNNGFFGEQMGGQRVNVDITLDAIQEFQVVATGANAEFGRTAGGVVNVVSKSGTNTLHGTLFHFQRHEAMTSTASDGTEPTNFHREQTGGTIGGPIARDRAFFFAAVEHIGGDLQRANLSQQVGDQPCPIPNPTIQGHEALINSNPDCQRVALLNFMQENLGMDDGRPVDHPLDTTSIFAKFNYRLNDSNELAISYNFLDSTNENQTFDVETYGNSANGIEGAPARINVLNANLFTTLSTEMLNEFHFTYTRENRPRLAIDSPLKADTGMGFGPSFRFGNPFFLQPAVDEVFWRTQIRNNLSIVKGDHSIKLGGEWIHSLNDQVFRGFFTGRYIFDSPTGFLRYASPAAPGGWGPNTVTCSDGTYVTYPDPCPRGASLAGGPLLLYLQDVGTGFSGVPPPGASVISNDEIGFFVQDTWRVGQRLTLNLGLRWDMQLMADTVDPTRTAYAKFLNDPNFPSDGTIPNQTGMIQPRIGFSWDITGEAKSVLRANFGIYNPRQNMLTQVGSVTTNGLQQYTIVRDSSQVTFAEMPTWPGIYESEPLPEGEFAPFATIRVFDKDYKNPRVTSFNVGFEQEVSPDWAVYGDFTYAEGKNLTRFLNYNRSEPATPPVNGSSYSYGPGPYLIDIFELAVTNSRGHSEYKGVTVGFKKRFSEGYQLEGNYVWSKDEDDDSNERDPFTDRSFNFFDLDQDWGFSDRDIRHKLNFYGFTKLGPLDLNVRLQYRSAQPITAEPRVLEGVDRGRNSLRKDNEFFSLDWRLQWPIRFGAQQQFTLMPIVEMFNTTNSKNLVNPLTTPALFNFDGFIRLGIGDPRQLQIAVKFIW
jgi:hypothetical protein